MQVKISISSRLVPPKRRFLIGPPQDSGDVLRLMSLVLERADVELASGEGFDLPFAALLKLGTCNLPSIDDLSQFCHSRRCPKDWPSAFQNRWVSLNPKAQWPRVETNEVPNSGNANCPSGRFFDLLEFAIDSSSQFDVNGPEVCRVLAAVGQTLQAKDRRIGQRNRKLLQEYRKAALPRRATLPTVRVDEEPHIAVSRDPPWQLDFRGQEEEGACLRLDGLTLWRASHIGPKSADKSENQDATFAMTSPKMSGPSHIVFALADGVSTSMGSRLAASVAVRTFCETAFQHMSSEPIATGVELVEAAKKTQTALDDLARMLLTESDSYVFEIVRGSDFQPRGAIRVLENTLTPKITAIPAALNTTLVGGIARPKGTDGSYQVNLLRIGDGTTEHIDCEGRVTTVLDTDPEVKEISAALGPGPRSQALFEHPSDHLDTVSVVLGVGESLVISSDGLARGHQQMISTKLAQLLDEEFWQTARPERPDAALQVLHRACDLADELFKVDPKQSLFDDNVSLIIITLRG